MAEGALQIPPYPRQMTEILRFAVAHVESREDAENLAGALRRKRNVDPDEPAWVEVRISVASSAHVTAEQRELGLLGHVHACILQQRGEIVSRRPQHRIL